MALTLTKANATPYALKYTYSGTGSATATVSAATLIADCQSGPLKDLLTRVNAGITSTTWSDLPAAKAFSIYVLPRSTSGVAQDAAIVVDMTTGPNKLEALIAAGASTVIGEIELRYHHSMVR